MSYLLNGDRIIMGTDYYPEHWDEQLWDQDLDRMHETGIEVIRVAEFCGMYSSLQKENTPMISSTDSWICAKRRT